MVEFGRLMDKNDFLYIANLTQRRVVFNLLASERCSDVFALFNATTVFYLLHMFGLRDYDIEQYEIVLSA